MEFIQLQQQITELTAKVAALTTRQFNPRPCGEQTKAMLHLQQSWPPVVQLSNMSRSQILWTARPYLEDLETVGRQLLGAVVIPTHKPTTCHWRQ